MGFVSLLFALTLTLSVVEVTQYITYASARNYYASHLSPGHQAQQANKKYQALTQNDVFGPLLQNGWFEVQETPSIGDAGQQISDYEQPGGANGYKKRLFSGVKTIFNAKMLDFQIPFFGSTTNMQTESSGFKTTIGSYLGREPSIRECRSNFVEDRWRKIRQNLSVSGAAGYKTHTSDSGYYPISDNGC